VIDRFLTIGATFDWISPALSVIDELLFGELYRFQIEPCRYSGVEIARALRKKNVNAKARMVVDGKIVIDVRMKDAVKAQILLNTWKVPVLNPLPRKRPRRSGRKRLYHCKHCGTRYKQWRNKCSQCGAPM